MYDSTYFIFLNPYFATVYTQFFFPRFFSSLLWYVSQNIEKSTEICLLEAAWWKCLPIYNLLLFLACFRDQFCLEMVTKEIGSA